MMQHTKQYELNLIDKTDTFSPDPLNENTEKVEKALEAVRAGAAAETAAEAAARSKADADEAAARAKADADEAAARAKADADEAAARAKADKALDQRVTVLEAHKIAVGTYSFGGAQTMTVNLGFTPRAVLVENDMGGKSFFTSGFISSYSHITIIENGFVASRISSMEGKQCYLALA